MKCELEPIRIAQIIGKWLGGGVEAVVMNYYRNIDRDKIQFDFICDEDSTNIPFEEIEKLGGKVILIPPYQKVLKYHKELKRVLKEGKYKIVHSHINTLSVFSLFAAKCAGVPVRIAHSHSTTNQKEKKKNLIKQVLRPFSKLFATDYMCCSELAGRWLFGDREYDKGKVYLLNNAIDIEKFEYNEQIRKRKREELGIRDSTLVIGHVGRFVEQKNHMFLIDIFSQVHKKNEDTILLLIGQGPLQNQIKDKVKSLKLEKFVKFLGQRNDVNELYQSFDIFLLPSLYEGLGMVLIEAQCAGCYCIASTEVPKIAKVTNNLNFIKLEDSSELWGINAVKGLNKVNRKECIKSIKEFGYDIKEENKKLENYYLYRRCCNVTKN
ncbi:MAG: glycosyltransferase family 1 protein [Clostridia bacterium]|nr:glycosyltransferase family 1 protein [Clostridia bacterium]